jgi:undecaprenyl phosphate-alpha-L-ara4N flippase subunit ArnE
MTGEALGVALVVLCTIIEGFAQIFLKFSVMHPRVRFAWIAAGVSFYIAEIAVYTNALRLLAVSTAFAISSLSFVTVAVFAIWLLRERVTPMRWLGIALIMIGVALIVTYA